MAKRRGNKEGSIIQRANGSWRCQISLDGKRLSHTAKTRKECQDWLKKLNNDLDAGLSVSSTQQTLQEYLESWLVSIQTSIRPGTLYQYQMTCRRYIIPTLGCLKLAEVKPALIQKLLASKLQSGLGARTVEMIHAVLHRALVQAVKLEILGRNPVDATTPPKVEAKEMQFYDESQVSQLLIAAKGNKNEALYHLAVATGLRQSELLGLKWSDLDWQKKNLIVQRQLKRKFVKGDYFAPPKTKNGRRSVVLGSFTSAKLREHWNRQNELRILAGNRWQENDLIFPSSVGTPGDPSNLRIDYNRILVKAGLPKIRFHDLRHTAASLMLNHNVPVIVVSRMLGHYKPSTTLDIYGHLYSEMQDEAADLMDKLVTPILVQLPRDALQNSGK